MDNDKAQGLHELEQALATISENFPPMYWRLYQNCLSSGFTEDQSFKILMVYIHGNAGGKLQC